MPTMVKLTYIPIINKSKHGTVSIYNLIGARDMLNKQLNNKQ